VKLGDYNTLDVARRELRGEVPYGRRACTSGIRGSQNNHMDWRPGAGIRFFPDGAVRVAVWNLWCGLPNGRKSLAHTARRARPRFG